MAQCCGCGKFMATKVDCIRCSKCPGTYHPMCVGFTAAKITPNWLCPSCKAKIPRTDNSATPVKGPSDGNIDNSTSQPATITCQSTTTNPSSENYEPTAESADLIVAYEIRCFREELSATRVELRQFREEIASLKADVGLCSERMVVVEVKVACLEKRFDEKEPSSYDHLEETIAELKLQLNDRDQELLQNDVVIRGIPETKD